MPVLDTYGSRTRTAGRLAGQVAARLRVRFVAQESPSLGTFYRAEAPPHRIEVRPNTGTDPRYPDMRALVLVTSPALDATLGTTFETVADLVHLSRNTVAARSGPPSLPLTPTEWRDADRNPGQPSGGLGT